MIRTGTNQMIIFNLPSVPEQNEAIDQNFDCHDIKPVFQLNLNQYVTRLMKFHD
jgi:hypothetical protein